MTRAGGRPSFSATQIIMRSNVVLPRSRSVAHWAPLARAAAGLVGFWAIVRSSRCVGGNQYALGDRLAAACNAEAQRAVGKCLLLDREQLARMHWLEKLCRANAPPPRGTRLALRGADHLIEQQHAGDDRRIGK